jgi:hypothetical protein
MTVLRFQIALPVLLVRVGRPVVVLLALVAAGLALQRVEAPAWDELQRRQPAMRWHSVEGVMGQGITFGLLGGFRSLAADLLWLHANARWERCDVAGTRAALALVAAVDPRPVDFWLNGARMIGYDMPVWRVAELGGEDAVPAVVRRRFEEEQARAAIAHLENGFASHPGHPLLHIEIANLQLQRLGEVAAAAEHYRLASVQPTAPFYAARVHAELLRRLGREREALAWLVALHPRLPPQNPYAMADTVLGRIRELEDRLALASAARYQPGRE